MSGRFAGVVIVAAGRGERFGDSGKVLSMAAGRPLLAWSLDVVMRTETASEVAVVCGNHTKAAIDRLVGDYSARMLVRTCPGGDTRQESVRSGIECLSGGVEVAVIHDAARPLATPQMFDACAEAARKHGAAITATPVTDTIKDVDGDLILCTVPRENLWAAQTPQAFRLDVLKEAFGDATAQGLTFTDEAGLLEHLGINVRISTGAPSNMKVTVSEDLDVVDLLLRQRQARGETNVSS